MADLHVKVLNEATNQLDPSFELSKPLLQLETILAEIREFIREEIEPHNPDNMFVDDMVKALKAMMDRSVLESNTRFFYPMENFALEVTEWNRHVPRNQIVDLRALRSTIVCWRKQACEWSAIASEAVEHFQQDVHDCALSLVQVLLGRGNKAEASGLVNKKSLAAPFMLYFTSAFVGDFDLRLALLDRMIEVFESLDKHSVEQLRVVKRYFEPFSSEIKSALDKQSKTIRREYEVSFKTGRLFAEDKLKSHYKVWLMLH